MRQRARDQGSGTRKRFAKLAENIELGEGAAYVDERVLRDCFGAGRLTEGIALEIETDYMPRVQLKLWPGQKIYCEQNHEVLIYSERSRIGEAPLSFKNPTRSGLRKFKEPVSAAESDEILRKVRALVC